MISLNGLTIHQVGRSCGWYQNRGCRTVKHRVPGVYSLTYTDQAGNRSERVTRTVTVVNDDPDSLALSANKVEENLPKGRAVGRFSWSDPNDPEGRGEYTIQIINEEAKALFRIDDNHTLLTRVPLDYESNSSHSVLIRVADAYGGTLEQSFVIEVIDAFLPIVYTEDPDGWSEALGGGSGNGRGGSTGVSVRGFLVSSFAEAKLEDTGTIRVISGKGPGAYTQRVNGLQPNKEYYVRAYATNGEGTAYGSSLKIDSMAYELAPGWSNAKKANFGEDWWSSPWFGMFHLQDDSGWIHHLSMGWSYAIRPAGVESGSGPKQPDGSGRLKGSIPSCIPMIPNPGSIFMESPKTKSYSSAIPIVDGW